MLKSTGVSAMTKAHGLTGLPGGIWTHLKPEFELPVGVHVQAANMKRLRATRTPRQIRRQAEWRAFDHDINEGRRLTVVAHMDNTDPTHDRHGLADHRDGGKLKRIRHQDTVTWPIEGCALRLSGRASCGKATNGS